MIHKNVVSGFNHLIIKEKDTIGVGIYSCLWSRRRERG